MSNFYPNVSNYNPASSPLPRSPVYLFAVDTQLFRTAEHYYQWRKFRVIDPHYAESVILHCVTAQDVKRKAGKVDISVFTHFDETAWAAYEDIYAQSWKPAEGSPAFLRRFAREEAEASRLRLGLARIRSANGSGRAIAAQVWTVEGGTAYIHKLAHTEDARTLSPGTLLSAALFEQVIDRDRVTLVDFGTGDDPYKRDWMEASRPRYRLDMMRPGVAALWPQIARASVKRLARAISHG